MSGGSLGRPRARALAAALGALAVLVSPARSFAQVDFFLYRQGGMGGLRQVAPATAEAAFSSSPPVNLLGGNPWQDIGTWTGRLAIRSPVYVISVSDLHVWLGLLADADAGAAFDLEAEAWIKGAGSEPVRVGHGVKRCIAGLAAGASRAREAEVSLASVRASFKGGTESIFLKLRTRIGTTPDDHPCAGGGSGNASAQGLRVYYGGTGQPSRLGLLIAMP